MLLKLIKFCKLRLFQDIKFDFKNVELCSIMARTKNRKRRGKNDKEAGKGRKFKPGENPRYDAPGNRGTYELAAKKNEKFEEYYKAQKLVPEKDWDTFMSTLRSPLPSTFRITGIRSQASELLKSLKGDFFSKFGEETTEDGDNVDGEEPPLDPPVPLPWYPGELAWQLNFDRKYIRHSTKMKDLHEFLITETETGNISRQEAVSMIPPLVLDIQPHHRVLDMCAAPGSKTSQLIEMLHSDEKQAVPEGFVIANDADNKRCYLMVHQVKRLESPNFMIINHDASQLPLMKLNEDPDPAVSRLNFDRVLADVPCSGDATMRKNSDVWGKWNPGAGFSLHGLQSRILQRGLELLKVGGRLVYSTCSFNPIENEAVIAGMLQKCEGSVELIDVSNELPGLKHNNGLETWKVITKQGEIFNKWEEVPDNLRTQIRETMFPPEAETVKTLHLERCMRVLPHQQNTGGFFISALVKKDDLPWHKKANQNKNETNGADGESGDKVETKKREADSDLFEHRPPQKKQKMFGYKEDPFIFLEENNPHMVSVKQFFGVSDGLKNTQMLVRCATESRKRRNLYYTSAHIRNIVELNKDRVRFINMGLKMFARSESKWTKCSFRLVQDGINTLYPFMSGRIVQITKEDIGTLLTQENPFLSKMTKSSEEQMKKLDQGSLTFVFNPESDDRPDSPKCRIVLSGWLGKTSCRTFLAKMERSHYARLAGYRLKTKEEYLADKAAKNAAAGTSADADDIGNGDDLDMEGQDNLDIKDNLDGEKNEDLKDEKEEDTVEQPKEEQPKDSEEIKVENDSNVESKDSNEQKVDSAANESVKEETDQT